MLLKQYSKTCLTSKNKQLFGLYFNSHFKMFIYKEYIKTDIFKKIDLECVCRYTAIIISKTHMFLNKMKNIL